MFGKTLLQWSEPARSRYRLARASGGLPRLFISDLLAEGLPAIIILCAIWAFALLAGAKVMQFWKALLLFLGFAVCIALLQGVLFLLTSSIRITERQIYVGARRWRNGSVRAWSWEERTTDMEPQVLALKMKIHGTVRIALPRELDRRTVEEALEKAGIRRG